MSLYRYFSSHADTTLREEKLKLSKPSEFNDPFEFVYRYEGKFSQRNLKRRFREPETKAAFRKEIELRLGRRISRKELKQYAQDILPAAANKIDKGETPILVKPDFCKNLADKYWRVCCFSDSKIKETDEILLWSHYAAKHTGIRIEFEFPSLPLAPELQFQSIQYRSHRTAFPINDHRNETAQSESIKALCITKSDVWSYENEVRILFPTALFSVDPCYLGFDKECVKSICFGINYPREDRTKFVNSLRTSYPKARWLQAFHHSSDFSIVYQEI